MMRVALVGAGFIAGAHGSALGRLAEMRGDLAVTAVVDRARPRAEALARALGDAAVFTSPKALIAAQAADVAHVLVPPDLHRAVAEPLLEAGLAVLLEKPMAHSAEDASALSECARRHAVALGINHNFVFHPAFSRLCNRVRRGEIGPLRHVQIQCHMPLRQWDAGQTGHWMFRRPLNLLLEQAVHPLSQLRALTGEVEALSVLSLPPRRAVGAPPFYDRWLVSGRAGDVGLQVELAFGQSFPVWTVSVTGEDGRLEADIIRNRLLPDLPTPYMPQRDTFAANLAAARHIRADAWSNIAGYSASMLGLANSNDPFQLSMDRSITAFYRALVKEPSALDGEGGVRLVALCEAIARHATPAEEASAPSFAAAPAPGEEAPLALVIGGSGFIGKALVRRLAERGWRVRVLARSLPPDRPLFDHPAIEEVRGDARAFEDVAAAARGAATVVNLAHGGGESSRESLRRAMVEGVETMAAACKAAGAGHLIHAGTIASLYLGDPRAVVTGATPIDRKSRRRADYAWAKAEAEKALRTAAGEGIAVTIIRPGLVLGPGSPAFHGGLGHFNRQTFCLGWNRGTNPLPLVLVDDVADAFVAAAEHPHSVAGRSYNLAGDVRLSASEFIRQLAERTGRPIRFIPQSPARQYLVELAKYTVKRIGGRRMPPPSLRDIRSRGLVSRLDCSDAKRDLDWTPEADIERFLSRALGDTEA